MTASTVSVPVHICSRPMLACIEALKQAYSAGEVSPERVQECVNMGPDVARCERVNCTAHGAGELVFLLHPGERLLPLVAARLAPEFHSGICAGCELHGGPRGK